MNFTEEQINRYSRHIILPEVGGKGQEKISNGKVLIIGAGGLGAPAALYLGAAGVGTIGIADGDEVDLTNLQRQIIHHTPDVGRPKVVSAREKINQINPNVNVIIYQTKVDSHNILEIMKDYDVVMDGTDNFAAKFLINDAAVMAGKPLVHGGILRFVGQLFTIVPGETACYRCVFLSPPPPDAVPTCKEAGVLGAIAGQVGVLQAIEVLKLLIGIGKPLKNRLLTYDALKLKWREIALKKNQDCPICGENPKIKSLIDYEQVVCELR